MTRIIIGWDVETHLIEKGSNTPPLVCLSASGGDDSLGVVQRWLAPKGSAGAVLLTPDSTFTLPHVWGRNRNHEWELVVPASHALDLLLTLADTADVMVAANGRYDWAVMCNEHPELLPVVAHYLEEGKIACTQIREQLWSIATGNFKYDTRTKRKDPVFSLAYLVLVHLGVDISDKKSRTDKHGNIVGNVNSWRLRYNELDGVPIDEWPIEALTYSAEDSLYARRVWYEQAKPLKFPEGVVVHKDGTMQNETEQTAADWVLYLMACHGVKTSHPEVLEFERKIRIMVKSAMDAGKEAGFVVINRCKGCSGTGLSGEVPDLTTCPDCGGKDHDACNTQGLYGKFKNGKAKSYTAPTTKTNQARLRALTSHAYGGNPPMTTKKPGASANWKSQVSIDGDSLAGSCHPLLEQYGEGKSAIKMLETYLPILLQGTSKPICSRPNVIVRTGRTSWRNPNFQNPPSKGGFRDCFIPRPGTVYASLDYSTLELCTLAQVNLKLFGYSKMADLCNAGKDLHLAFAAESYLKMPYDEAKAIHDDPTHPRWAEVDERRDRAKPANFGFPGMLGVKAYVKYAKGYGIKLNFNEATDTKNAWFNLFPEMKSFRKMISQACDTGVDGRFTVKQLGSGRLRAGCSYTSGANTWFQGLAADGAKAALWALFKACYLDESSALYGVRMWAFIHDEVLFEGDETTAHLWAPEAARIMVEAMSLYIPDVPSQVEPALMYRWNKKAKTVYNEEGHLVPWEPKT